MKIIKDNYTKTYECECAKCKSVYQFTQNEAIDGDGVKVFCPLCNSATYLAPNRDEKFQNVIEVTKSAKKVVKQTGKENGQHSKQKPKTDTKKQVLLETKNN